MPISYNNNHRVVGSSLQPLTKVVFPKLKCVGSNVFVTADLGISVWEKFRNTYAMINTPYLGFNEFKAILVSN